MFEDEEKRESRQREEKRRAKERADLIKADVCAVMEKPEARRLLAEFLDVAGIDVSPLRSDPIFMGAAVGWQDAASWWVNLIRKYCPERESQMRAEAKKAAKMMQTDEDTTDDN